MMNTELNHTHSFEPVLKDIISLPGPKANKLFIDTITKLSDEYKPQFAKYVVDTLKENINTINKQANSLDDVNNSLQQINKLVGIVSTIKILNIFDQDTIKKLAEEIDNLSKEASALALRVKVAEPDKKEESKKEPDVKEEAKEELKQEVKTDEKEEQKQEQENIPQTPIQLQDIKEEKEDIKEEDTSSKVKDILDETHETISNIVKVLENEISHETVDVSHETLRKMYETIKRHKDKSEIAYITYEALKEIAYLTRVAPTLQSMAHLLTILGFKTLHLHARHLSKQTKEVIERYKEEIKDK